MIPYPSVDPVWISEIPAGAEILGGDVWGTKIAAPQARPMILYPPVGPLWARKYQPEPRSWGEHQNRSTPGGAYDSISVCRPSLGLGNTSRSRDPGRRRLGSTKIAAHRAGPMIPYPSVDPLWGSEIPAGAEICVLCSVYVCSVCIVYCCVVCSV